MGVIPIQALGMVGRDLDFVMVVLAGFDFEQDVVGVADRRDVQAVRVQVGLVGRVVDERPR